MAQIILVGTDGSQGADKAIEFALQHAKNYEMSLEVVHVIEWTPYSFELPEELEIRHKMRESEIKSADEQIIAPILAKYGDQGVEIIGTVRHGDVSEVLCELAQAHEVAHIVLGKKGRSRIQELLHGNVVGRMVQVSPVPISIVP